MLCPICLETFPSGVRTACCSNLQHKECLDTWLARYGTSCPLCRGEPKLLKKRYPLLTKTWKYCPKCETYGFLFCKAPCCDRTIHISCCSEFSCDFCLDQKKYSRRPKLDNLQFRDFNARIIVNGRMEILYSYEVVGTKAIRLAEALKRRLNHAAMKKILHLAFKYDRGEFCGCIYYPHLRWACLNFGHKDLV